MSSTGPSGEAIRVLIVDDHRMVAEGLATILNRHADMQVVGVADTIAAGVRLAETLAPDVVVMDYLFPDGDGVDATSRIRARQPDVQIVMVTASAHDTVLAAALEAGCAAFVTKDRAAEDVAGAVRAARAGEATIPADMLVRLLPHLQSGGKQTPTLTSREHEVLQLVVDGMSNQEIADQLVVAVSTVRNHVQNILGKLDAHSRLQAVTAAVRQGIVRYPE